MSQNPSASKMAMVTSRALAIIGNLRESQPYFFRDSPLFLGAGRQPEGNGGPSEARRGCRESRSMGRDLARVARRTTEERRKWRAEVGPMLPGAGPRPLRWELGKGDSFE